MKFKSEYLFATFILLGVALFSISGFPIIMLNNGVDVLITIVSSIVLLILSAMLAMLNYAFYNSAKSRDQRSNAYDDIVKKRNQNK